MKELQRILKDYQGVLKYVNDTWLNPFKEMFVSLWTDKYLHFGNHTTNRVESQHARFKLYLDSPQSDLQSSLYDVHHMINAQETHIKVSFENSRTVIKHRYKIPQFNELRGFVSIHALDLIYKELERCNNVGVFSENCGCRLRTSHGLPCAHEQALYYSQSRPIPLDSIDVFWRKLDFTPCIALHDDDIGCEEEVQRFTDMFRKQSQPNKVSLLRRLKEIFVPSTISMREPAVQKTSRGRPSLKDKLSRSFRFTSSTQEPPRRSYCDKSGFDGIDISRYQAPARHSSYVSGYQAPTPNIDKNIEFQDQFEPIFHPYIIQVQDVKPDGNCAFRAISVCLGFGEDNWPNIRRELLEELNMYRTEYEEMFNPFCFAQVGASLSWFHEDRFAPFDYWWTVPEMGVLTASRYNRILHVLNSTGSCTYLPLRSTPQHWTKHSPIAIAFVNGNHYVRVKLEGGYPVPTISSQWLRYRYPCAIGWATPYQARIKRYTDYQESNKDTVDHVELDD